MANRLSVEDHNSLVKAVQACCYPSHNDTLTQLIQSEEEAYRLLTEKDAIMKELEREHDYAKRQAIEWNEKAVALKEENARLRKALEEARQADKVAKKAIDDMGKVINQKGARICELEEQLTAALGEGDKE